MVIQIGVIDHKYGMNFYADRTVEGLTKKLADYCRDWWEEEMGNHRLPEHDEDILTLYFEHVEGEYVHREEAYLGD